MFPWRQTADSELGVVNSPTACLLKQGNIFMEDPLIQYYYFMPKLTRCVYGADGLVAGKSEFRILSSVCCSV